MQCSFSFDVLPARRLIHVKMAGFFITSDVDRFRRDLQNALARLGAKPNHHRMLVDIREMSIQSQEAVGHFRAIFTEPSFHSQRLAIVVSSSLSRSQVKRAAEGRGAQYFATLDEAEEWLQSPDAQAA